MYESVGLRTITRWLSWFRELPEDEVKQDRGGNIWFHNLEQYGIPWDKYSDLVHWGGDVTPRKAKWMVRLQQIRHGGRPFTPKILMEFTNDFVQEEQREMLGLSHNLGGISMRLKFRLLSSRERGDTNES